MAELIGQYRVKEPLTNHNAGFSKWGFGYRDGERYFIKEFLSPVWPMDNRKISAEALKKRRDVCEQFTKEKIHLFNRINNASDGNLMHFYHFFRYKSRYYIAGDAVNSISIEEVQSLGLLDKAMLLHILAHSMRDLHRAGIVHGDLKLDNILFYRTKRGTVSAKIIDLDNAFIPEEKLPDPDNLNCDQMYLAPEMFRYIKGEKLKINAKADVFAMGLVFFEIMTGTKPGFSTTYRYPFSVLLNGEKLDLSLLKENTIREIIFGMLHVDPVKRLDMREVFTYLSYYRHVTVTEIDGLKTTVGKSSGTYDASSYFYEPAD